MDKHFIECQIEDLFDWIYVQDTDFSEANLTSSNGKYSFIEYHADVLKHAANRYQILVYIDNQKAAYKRLILK